MRGDRRFQRTFWGLLFFLLLLATPIRVFGEEGDESASRLPDAYTDFLELLPQELLSLLPEGILSADAEEVSAAVGEMGDFSYLLETLMALFGLRVGECIKLFAATVGLLLLSAVSRSVASHLGGGQLSSALSLCSSLALTAALLAQGYVGVSGVSNYLDTLAQVTAASVPLMGSLYAMGGNAAAAAASASSLSLFLALLEGVITKSMVPFCGICLGFAVVNTCAPGLRLQSLIGTIKKHYTTALSFLMMLLLAMLGAQSVLAAGKDSLAMKSVKFAAGSMIPVVGGSVSELLRTVSTGVEYLRGSVGVCGVLLLFLLLLPTLVELLLVRLTWELSASVADMLGCDSEKKLLDEFASVSGYLIAAVAVTSSLPVLAFSLLLHCASAIG